MSTSNSNNGEISGGGPLLAGAGILLIGAIIGGGSKSLLKNSMMRYNEVGGSKTSLFPSFVPVNGNNAVGFCLQRNF